MVSILMPLVIKHIQGSSKNGHATYQDGSRRPRRNRTDDGSTRSDASARDGSRFLRRRVQRNGTSQSHFWRGGSVFHRSGKKRCFQMHKKYGMFGHAQG